MDLTKRMRYVGQVSMGIAFAVLSPVAIGLGGTSQSLLIAKARPLTKMDVKKTAVCWLSTHQLLMVKTQREANMDISKEDVSSWKAWRGSADILDTSAHKTRHLNGLTKRLNRAAPSPEFGPWRFERSPNGPWLLWETSALGDGWPSAHAAYLDGSHHREWSRNRYEEKFFQGSHLLVQLNAHDPLVVRDLMTPKRDKECSGTKQIRAVLARHAVDNPFFITVPNDSEMPIRNNIEITKYRTQDRDRRIRAEGDEGKDAPAPVQTTYLKIPMGAACQRATVSPTQQAIFYDLLIPQPPPHQGSPHATVSTLNPKPILTEELWVSRTDGRGMREIGHVPNRLDANGKPDEELQDIRWLPDGKQISFVYHGMLYVVPAEPGK